MINESIRIEQVATIQENGLIHIRVLKEGVIHAAAWQRIPDRETATSSPASMNKAKVENRLATVVQVQAGRRRTRPLSPGLGARASEIEKELSPEVELPFEAVQRGDLAKPI